GRRAADRTGYRVRFRCGGRCPTLPAGRQPTAGRRADPSEAAGAAIPPADFPPEAPVRKRGGAVGCSAAFAAVLPCRYGPSRLRSPHQAPTARPHAASGRQRPDRGFLFSPSAGQETNRPETHSRTRTPASESCLGKLYIHSLASANPERPTTYL